VNAHEGKAGMMLFAGKTVWSMPERFVCTTLAKKALYKYSSFPFFPKRRQSLLAKFQPMSIVAKRLDGSRWHLAWRWA